jgi:hypothetical protein
MIQFTYKLKLDERVHPPLQPGEGRHGGWFA